MLSETLMCGDASVVVEERSVDRTVDGTAFYMVKALLLLDV
jgi:hypothetical protein